MASSVASSSTAVTQLAQAPSPTSPSSPRKSPLATLQSIPLRMRPATPAGYSSTQSAYSRRRGSERIIILPPVAKFAPPSYRAPVRPHLPPPPVSPVSPVSPSPVSPALSWPVYQAAFRSCMASNSDSTPSSPSSHIPREFHRRAQVMA